MRGGARVGWPQNLNTRTHAKDACTTGTVIWLASYMEPTTGAHEESSHICRRNRRRSREDASDSCISLCWGRSHKRDIFRVCVLFMLCCFFGVHCLTQLESLEYTHSLQRDKNHSVFILSNLTTECKFQTRFRAADKPGLDICTGHC